MPDLYTIGYHSDEMESCHVHLDGSGDLFDVTLYDSNVIDPATGRNCRDQSLADLGALVALANAALAAGLKGEDMTESIADDEIRALAKERYGSNIEIDPEAVVSRGQDPGAFVAAWVWVSFPEQEA